MNTGRVVTQVLQRFRHPEHGYRSCLGLLSLVRRYGPQRVEAACSLALELGAAQYRHVRDIHEPWARSHRTSCTGPRVGLPRARQPARRVVLLLMTRSIRVLNPKDFHIMMNNTLAQLRDLKLAGMASAVEEQLSSAASTSLRFEERLALMVDREVHHRDDKHRAALMKRAGLKYPQACIEDADSKPGRGFERSSLMSLALSRWVEDGAAILITDPTGSGKSWLACALAQYTCRRGHSALYLRVSRLGEDLRVLHGNGGFGRWLAALARTDVLLLDDWGLADLDGQPRADLMEVIDDRSGTRPTSVTSKLPIEHWHAWIGDATIADAILDRLLSRSHRLNLKGQSMRQSKVADAQTENSAGTALQGDTA